MKQRLFLAFTVLTLMSCQLFSVNSAPQADPTPSISPTTITIATSSPPTPTQPDQQNSSSTATAPPNRNLAKFDVDVSHPFTNTSLDNWQASTYPLQLDALPIDLNQVDNSAVIAGLNEEQRGMLSNDGFTVLPTQEQQFEDIRYALVEQTGQPYYLTTDAAFHALHVNFDELLKALEQQQLRPQMITLLEALLTQTTMYQESMQDTPIASDTRLASAYLAVALQLFNPQYNPPEALKALVDPQVRQILEGSGIEESRLLPGFKDDYAAYKPVGHYTTHPDLESYFRGMTWLGRTAFAFKGPEQANFIPSRVPLILTLALREAHLPEDQPAAQAWGQVHEVLTFLVGPSDNPGPLELSALMDMIYGPGISIEQLTDNAHWQAFLSRVDELPAPQINSTFVNSTKALEASRDWRLMGQRFTIDGMILQNMVMDKVGTKEKPRKLPSGLDVMAAFGSPAALQALHDSGEDSYANYLTQLEKMQAAVQAQPEDEWLLRFASGWMYAFLPQIAIKNEAFPPYMRSAAWADKELNSALGSWAELKHDTVLYAKMPEFMGGGGPPASGPPPAYVEPNPNVFYRLAYLAHNLSDGLAMRNLAFDPQVDAPNTQQIIGIDILVNGMSRLADQYKKLGDIAIREMNGQTLTEEERYAITSCLGLVECDDTILPEKPPLPVIAAVAGADNQVLEVGVGEVNRIYVVVPLDGRLSVAQGGVFSYYEFSQPRSARLTDEDWRQLLISQPPDAPAWSSSFVLPGGEVRQVLAFRIDDFYLITPEGGTPPLNVRAEPSPTATVKATLAAGTYLRIVDGPVLAGGKTWWKVQEEFGGDEGWVAENPAWYERAHGQ